MNGNHYLELRIPPLALCIVASVMMLGISTLTPSLNFPLPAKNLLAMAAAALGAAACISGVVEFRRAKTTVNPMRAVMTTALVTQGVYRMSRNPMYLGFLLLLSAVALYLANAVALLVLPIFILYMNCFQIAPEEKALRGLFGEVFDSYIEQTRRWI